jgi:hypothetical protein
MLEDELHFSISVINYHQFYGSTHKTAEQESKRPNASSVCFTNISMDGLSGKYSGGPPKVVLSSSFLPHIF